MTEMREVTLYAPKGVTPIAHHGASSVIGRIDAVSGLVLKYPKEEWWIDNASDDALRLKNKFNVEAAILRELGAHPRIVGYLCYSQEPSLLGLLLIEAANGDLQQYLDSAFHKVDESVKMKWCIQAAQAVEYCHKKNILHCDLRPANFLLDDKLDLSLGDFGGSQFRLLSGDGLPDYGFFDPREDLFLPTEAMDIFGLGSIMYTIMTGHFPHGSPGLATSSWEDISTYQTRVDALFRGGSFPDVADVKCGQVIRGCWMQDIKSASEVVDSLLNQ